MIDFRRPFQLDRFQLDALEAIERGASVIVAAPTGAGKTVIAEYAIERALREGRRVIYTAPIKALSNQKFRDFSASWGDRVGIMTGDVTVNPGAPTLIMTTEIFRNTIFDDVERLHDVSTVIFDEVHYLDDYERGTVWEESIIFAPPQVRLLALSATVSNIEEFAAWIRDVRGHEVCVVRAEERPVPLELNVYTPEIGALPVDEGLTELDRRRRRDGRARDARRFRGRRENLRAYYRRANLALVEEIQRRRQLPCIFFAFGRSLCEDLSRASVERMSLLDAKEAARMRAAVTRLFEEFEIEPDETSTLASRCLRSGIGFHHAGLLPTLKEVVERLFTSGLVKLLFTTETFALGVNMPARSVAFEGLRKFNGVTRVYLRTREFQQMAGRAGRRGIDTEGHVFATLHPKLDQPEAVRSIVSGEVEPVRSQFNLSYSTLLHLYEHLGEEIYAACERSFLAWQITHRKPARHQGRRREKREKRDKRSDRHPQARGGRGGRGRRGRRQHEEPPAQPATRAVPTKIKDVVDQVRRRMRVLEDLGYIEQGKVTRKGQFAARVYGYELQASELLFRGTLARLDTHRLVVLAAAIVYESRHDAWYEEPHPDRAVPGLKREARRIVREIRKTERRHGVSEPTRRPDWLLTRAVQAWAGGAEFTELRDYADVSEGDICRALRLVIQFMRQVMKPLTDFADIPDAAELAEKLSGAIKLIKRDVVDAEWQLQLAERADALGEDDEADAGEGEGESESEAPAPVEEAPVAPPRPDAPEGGGTDSDWTIPEG